VTLECKKRGTMKYLGVIFGGRSDGEEQYRETLGTVRRLTELVCRRKASAGLKVAVLNMCVLTKAAYPARFCQWDEGRMKRIERIFTAAYKKITKNMRSFPDQLVYMAAGDGGLGMPNFQDRVFKDTVAMLQRVWKSGGEASNAVDALYERAARAAGEDTVPGIGTVLSPSGQGIWIDRVLERGASLGLALARGGRPTPERLKVVDAPDLTTGKARRQDGAAETEVVRGQCWWDPTDRRAYELLGQVREEWEVRIWEPCEGPRVGGGPIPWRLRRRRPDIAGMKLRLSPLSDCRGGGSEATWPGPGEGCLRVFLEQDKVGDFRRAASDREKDRLVTRIVEVARVEIVKEEARAGTTWVDEVLEHALRFTRPMIVTDGSFVTEGRVRGMVEKKGKGTGRGALVMMDEGATMEPALYVIFDTPGRKFDSAFDLETAMTAAAAQLAERLTIRPKVFTDCKSTIDRAEKGGRLENQATRGHTSVIDYIRWALKRGLMTLEHVRGHPDEKKAHAEWTDQDLGIIWADLLAGGKWDVGRVEQNAENYRVHKFAFEEALSGVTALESSWTWMEGVAPLIGSIEGKIAEDRRSKYLETRDDLRQEAGRAAEWVGRTYKFAAKHWKKLGSGTAARARSARLRFDKQWDGRNEGKGVGDGSPLGCPLCGEPDGGDHWARSCGRGSLTRIRGKAENEIRALVGALVRGRRKGRASDAMLRVAHSLQDLVLSREGGVYRLWCGLWPYGWLDGQDDDARRLEEGEAERLGTLFGKVADITIAAVSELWEERANLIKEERGGAPEDPEAAGGLEEAAEEDDLEPPEPAPGTIQFYFGAQRRREAAGRGEARACGWGPGDIRSFFGGAGGQRHAQGGLGVGGGGGRGAGSTNNDNDNNNNNNNDNNTNNDNSNNNNNNSDDNGNSGDGNNSNGDDNGKGGSNDAVSGGGDEDNTGGDNSSGGSNNNNDNNNNNNINSNINNEDCDGDNADTRGGVRDNGDSDGEGEGLEGLDEWEARMAERRLERRREAREERRQTSAMMRRCIQEMTMVSDSDGDDNEADGSRQGGAKGRGQGSVSVTTEDRRGRGPVYVSNHFARRGSSHAPPPFGDPPD
jgi:hypothetical protein